jgi:hypothetical protein
MFDWGFFPYLVYIEWTCRVCVCVCCPHDTTTAFDAETVVFGLSVGLSVYLHKSLGHEREEKCLALVLVLSWLVCW